MPVFKMLPSDELVAFCQSFGLFLKPLARITITIYIPEKSIIGKTISNWELMETLKKKITPETFISIKVCISSLSKVVLEAEVKSIRQQEIIIKKLDGTFIKLSGFSEKFQINVFPCKIRTLKKNEWESYFKENKSMEEHAYTIYVSGLPVAWFKDSDTGLNVPSKEHVVEIFSKFGPIKNIDIPILDTYRERIISFLETGCDIYEQNNGFRKTPFPTSSLLFDAYLQFERYSSFCDCISTLNGMKLVYVKTDDKNSPYFSNFELDFDRKEHFSLKNITRRNEIRNELIEKDTLKQRKVNEERFLLENSKIEQEKKEEEEKRTIIERETQERRATEAAKLKQLQNDNERRKIEEAERIKSKKEQKRLKREAKIYELEENLHAIEACRIHAAHTLLRYIFTSIEKKIRKPSKSHHSHKIHKHKSAHSSHAHHHR